MRWPEKVNARWLLTGLGALTLAASGAGLAVNLWMLRSTRALVFFTADEVPARDAAIVPGARVYPDGRPSPALADRLSAALALYEAGRVRRILVSGDAAAVEYDEVVAMRRWLEARGVATDDILADERGLRTIDTMVRAATVYQIRGAVVCTQAYHLPRSLFLARRNGLDAVGLVSDAHIYPGQPYFRLREMAARVMAFLEG